MKTTEDKNYEGVKAFLIARVSDTRQSDALPAQNLRLKAYEKARATRLNFISRFLDF